jgi:hypothetical protein
VVDVYVLVFIADMRPYLSVCWIDCGSFSSHPTPLLTPSPPSTRHTRTLTSVITQGALICPSAADDDDEEDEEEEGEGDDGKSNSNSNSTAAAASNNKRSRRRPRRLQPLSFFLPLQQFGFPMRNLSLQRRMAYELLFYRAGGERGGEEGVKVSRSVGLCVYV